tara:strand:- start:5074 stop:5763 length:690 start_codon:yes stop_codon:yes gene_type:complete
MELILFFLFLPFSSADLIMEIPNMPPENYVPMDNMIAGTLWAMGVCSCVGIVCNHKKKVPIKVEQCEHDDYYETKNYYKIQIHDKQKPNKHKLNKLKNDLKEMMNAIKSLEDEIEEEEQEKYNKEKDKFNKENNISMDIPENIKYKFGKGAISIKENSKYYHGITIHDKKKYMNDYNHRFFERLDDKKINWFLGTKNPNEYCCNCSLDQENSKRRKVFKIYKCNGHEIQ